MPRDVVEAVFVEMLKVRLYWALSYLIWLQMSRFSAGNVYKIVLNNYLLFEMCSVTSVSKSGT